MARVLSSAARECSRKSKGKRGAVPFARWRQAERALLDREIGSGGNDIDMFGLERHAVRGLLHLHPRMAGQQIDHHARMGRVEVLDQNERHAAAGRQRVKKLAGGVEAAGRRADPDDGEGEAPGRSRGFRQGAPFRRRPRGGGCSRLRSCRHISPFACSRSRSWETRIGTPESGSAGFRILGQIGADRPLVNQIIDHDVAASFQTLLSVDRL